MHLQLDSGKATTNFLNAQNHSSSSPDHPSTSSRLGLAVSAQATAGARYPLYQIVDDSLLSTMQKFKL